MIQIIFESLIKKTIMNPKVSRREIVNQTLKEYELNASYLIEQSIKKLRIIQYSMEIEAGKQIDAAKKFEMEKIAQQAKEEIGFRKTKDNRSQQKQQFGSPLSVWSQHYHSIFRAIKGMIGLYQSRSSQPYFSQQQGTNSSVKRKYSSDKLKNI